MSLATLFSHSRLQSLLFKEINQILRDKQLVSLLIGPPVVQLVLYGFALNPDVKHLRMSVADLSNTPFSRELVSEVVNSHIFDIHESNQSISELGKMVARGDTDLAMIIPPEAARNFKSGKKVPIQVLVDGVDANTAGIAQGFMNQTMQAVDTKLRFATTPALPLETAVSFLYNPGLVASWFFIPGVMGLVVVIAGTLVSSVSVIREKDSGTLEQLLMTPADPMEILAAKVIPLLVLLMGSVLLSLSLALVIFDIPMRGSFLLFLLVSILAIFVAISVGMALATFAGNQRQALLTSFFINLPLVQLSGAIAPIESMPAIFKNISLLDPLRYYVSALRAILLRGVGLETIWMDVMALAFFAVALFTLSASQFRKQLK